MPKTFNYAQFAAMFVDLNDVLTWRVDNDHGHPTCEAADSDVAARLIDRGWAKPDEAADVTRQFWGWLAVGGARRAS
jgi:hypothetical protein